VIAQYVSDFLLIFLVGVGLLQVGKALFSILGFEADDEEEEDDRFVARTVILWDLLRDDENDIVSVDDGSIGFMPVYDSEDDHDLMWPERESLRIGTLKISKAK